MNITPVFKNKENEHIVLESGREIWLSRSCAVVGEIFIKVISPFRPPEYRILLGKRGEKTPDFQGYWCLPCGYLDWNETAAEGLLREVYEECGVYLPNLNAIPGLISEIGGLLEESPQVSPWTVTSEPSGKQNVSLHFMSELTWSYEYELPALSFKNAEKGEVAELAWMKVDDALALNLAFNHNEVLKLAVSRLD